MIIIINKSFTTAFIKFTHFGFTRKNFKSKYIKIFSDKYTTNLRLIVQKYITLPFF